MRFSVLENFQKSIGLSFTDIGLLDSALTHRSSVNENLHSPGQRHNERMEFLGDAVLGQTIAFVLYRRLADSPEGELSRLKSLLVSEPCLAEIASRIGIPAVLNLGRGEELSGGRNKKAIIADALEALIGAVFIDKGMNEAETLVERLFEEPLRQALSSPSKDFKTIVQEYAQKYSKGLPLYILESSEGPVHAMVFWVSSTLDGRKFGPCSGHTKKEAEQAAAESLYTALKAESPLISSRLDEIIGL
ncbi:MAG: ribonuclease III [Spirochaetes bacterium]|nr:ribonuclease III [Spirochaetota bacterium]